MPEANFELMAVLKAHSVYWKSPDVCYFLLQHLFKSEEVDQQSVDN